MKRANRTSTLVDFARGKLSPEDSWKILDSIESTPDHSSELEVIIDVMNVSEERGELLYRQDANAQERSGQAETFLQRLLPKKVRLSPAFALGGVVVVILGMLVGIRLSTSDYYALAETGELRIESVVRGPGAEDFEVARQRIERNDIPGAIRVLQRYTRAFPEGVGTDYAHYCVGALYLKLARQTIVLLVPTFDAEDVNLALAHLADAIQETRNDVLAEDAYVLRAKGFIMINKPDAAIKELNNALKYNGPKQSEIHSLLRALAER
jgi:hypothetical protein